MRDEVAPKDRWQFDKEVADSFDNMLERSIPQYDLMRESVFKVACRYVQPKSEVVDLGCSRGEALAPLVKKYGSYNRYVGLEVSEPMLEAARKRFEGYIKTGIVDIRKHDLRDQYPAVESSVTLSILTLQFTPIEYRLRIVSDIYNSMLDGGAFILVEKVLGASAAIDALEVDLYYEMKRENGYTNDDIKRKRLSLEGILVPVTAKWNDEILKSAGFREVDCFWRWMNFAGWVAIK